MYEPWVAGAGVGGGVRGHARRNASFDEGSPPFPELGGRSRDVIVVSQQPSKDHLARRPSSKRFRDRKQTGETVGVAVDDHDRALSRRRGDALRAQLWIVLQNRPFELLQRWAWLDTELVDEQVTCLPVDVERISLPPRAVERQHQLSAEALVERMLADEHLKLPDEFDVAANSEVGFDPTLERAEAKLFEAENLRLNGRLVHDIGERRAAHGASHQRQGPGPACCVRDNQGRRACQSARCR